MHFSMFINIVGGIGLFLLGMVLMTDGLKALAGSKLRETLTHFTGGLFSSLMSGTWITAIIQSSSATTVTTIGFVSAGLLTFEQSIGVIFGANLGTTFTSWLVSVLGLKIKVGNIALPFIGLGAFMRLLGKEKAAQRGLVLAGFGLIFVGINTLQNGMEQFAVFFDPAQFDTSTTSSNILLILIGIIMTVIVQSSSAAIATTLTALHTNAITFEQGAALVIGQSIGTTITAWLASIGATVPAKRTAYTHIIFNVINGLVTFILLPFFIYSIDLIADHFSSINNTIKLAIFHTSMKLVGIAKVRDFLSNIRSEKGSKEERNRHIAILHAVDHLDQLLLACREFKHLKKFQQNKEINNLAQQLVHTIDSFIHKLEKIKTKEKLDNIKATSRSMKKFRKQQRELILDNTAGGKIDPNTALQQIELIRWLDRVTYRIYRTIYYLDFTASKEEK